MSTAKAEYAKSLRKLEEISESIHAQRKFKKQLSLLREPGVGQDENPSLPSFDLDDCYDRGSVVSGKSSSLNGDETDLKSVVRTMSCPANMSEAMQGLSLTANETPSCDVEESQKT